MPVRRSTLASWTLGIAVSLAFGAVGPASAQSVRGANGAPGATGADGAPGQPGGDGGDGESVVAIGTTPDSSGRVRAVADGGNGGIGGRGGNGIGPGQPGGVGGNGGDGGDASAIVDVTGFDEVSASADGGSAGGSLPGGVGQDGVQAPAGSPGRPGDASASAALSTDSDAQAIAGASATTAGTGGGSARASALVHNDGGSTGNGGAEARSSASGSGEIVEAIARATSDGGGAVTAVALSRSPVPDAAPQEMSAHAFGSNAGSGLVNVEAEVSGELDSATRVSLSAEGHSTGGGDVFVEALVEPSGDGTTVSLHDAVSGSTAGLLRLSQRIHESTHPSFRFVGGDGEMSLVAENAGGGDLVLDLDLTAGGSNGSTAAGDAVVGDVIGTSSHGADVDIRVSAAAGDGAGPISPGTVVQRGPTGEASRIYGSSNGGDVTVSAEFTGGSSQGDDYGLAATSIAMDSVVDGDTSGNLSLSQTARAGSGNADAGDGGEALSSLFKTTHSASLSLTANAHAGEAHGTPGQARVEIHGTNTGGSAAAAGVATGADSFGAEDGGAATLDATLRTLADGHDIDVDPAGLRAVGGLGSARAPGDSTDGGSARASSESVAEGDSAVSAGNTAIGGNGGSKVFGSPIRAGHGGVARSVVHALGGGASGVVASSNARGGVGGGSVQFFSRAGTGGDGGDATAFARAEGQGNVESIATAVGGDTQGARAGSAQARASAWGATGFARADASTGAQIPLTGFALGGSLRAVSEAQLPGLREVQAEATFGAALPDRAASQGASASAFITGAPLMQDQARARELNAGLDQFFATHAGARMVALADWTSVAHAAQSGPASFRTSLEMVISESETDTDILLAAFDIAWLGDEFVSFLYELDVDGVVTTHGFDDESELLAFFADELFVVGSDLDVGDVVRASFDIVLDAGSRFDMALAFAAVPEPGTGLLVGLGLIGIAIRRKRAH